MFGEVYLNVYLELLCTVQNAVMLVHKEQVINNASEIAIIQGTSDINE